eukprot:3076172-Prymnesium_polylepis.1
MLWVGPALSGVVATLRRGADGLAAAARVPTPQLRAHLAAELAWPWRPLARGATTARTRSQSLRFRAPSTMSTYVQAATRSRRQRCGPPTAERDPVATPGRRARFEEEEPLLDDGADANSEGQGQETTPKRERSSPLKGKYPARQRGAAQGAQAGGEGAQAVDGARARSHRVRVPGRQASRRLRSESAQPRAAAAGRRATGVQEAALWAGLHAAGALRREEGPRRRAAKALVFTSEASMDVAYDPTNPLTARQQLRLRDRYAYVDDGQGGSGRLCLGVPPKPNHKHDPDAVSKESNDNLGIMQAPLLMPFVMMSPNEITTAARASIEDKELLMPEEEGEGGGEEYTLEGCACSTLPSIGEVLDACADDKNLRTTAEQGVRPDDLFRGKTRVQLQADAMGWTQDK